MRPEVDTNNGKENQNNVWSCHGLDAIPQRKRVLLIDRQLSFTDGDVLAVQKVLSGSGRAGRIRMGKYIGHRLVARTELENTFWTDSTCCWTSKLSLKKNWSCQYFIDC